jgi:hypothetical protein
MLVVLVYYRFLLMRGFDTKHMTLQLYRHYQVLNLYGDHLCLIFYISTKNIDFMP